MGERTRGAAGVCGATRPGGWGSPWRMGTCMERHYAMWEVRYALAGLPCVHPAHELHAGAMAT